MLIFRSVSQTPPADVALATVAPRVALRSRAAWYAIALGGCLALAFGLRAVGLTWGFPYKFHIDEAFVVDVTQSLMGRFHESGSLNPEITSYGALPLYLLALAITAAAHVIEIAQAIIPLPINSAPPVYLARLLSVIESAATVWLTAELARRLFGRSVALLTAVLLAICLLPVREAHFGTVDTLLVALVALTLLLGEQLARRGRWTDYLKVGVTLALAASTKIVALLALGPVCVAHLYRRIQRAESEPPGAPARWGLLPLLSMLIVMGMVWLAINPYVLLEPHIYFDLDNNGSLRTQQLVARGELPVLYTLQFIDVTPYVYVITNLLRWGMGLPLEILSLCGVVYSLWRLLRALGVPRRFAKDRARAGFADAYLLSWLAIYFFIVGSSYAQFIRYILPLMPILCLLGSRLLVDLWQAGGRVARASGMTITAGVIAVSFAYTLGYLGIYREPDVRITAISWLKRHVPVGSSILVEKDESLFLHRQEFRESYGLTEYQWEVWNPYEIDGVKSVRYQAPALSVERTRQHLERLLTTDYIVITPNWRERFLLAHHRFPAQAEFYNRLFRGDAGYRLVEVFDPHPKLGPFTWADERAELTFRLFDHPTIFIFARESQAQPLQHRESQPAPSERL